MKLQKFENVDVIASLEAIMKQNTAFYQSDFDIDKQILRKAAVSLIPEDKRLLWFSRPSGTCPNNFALSYRLDSHIHDYNNQCQ